MHLASTTTDAYQKIPLDACLLHSVAECLILKINRVSCCCFVRDFLSALCCILRRIARRAPASAKNRSLEKL